MSTRIAILGFGEVGRALAERLVDERDLLVVAIADRSGGVIDRRGVDLRAAIDRKVRDGALGGDPSHGPEWIVRQRIADVVVDVLPTDLRTGEPSRALQEAALLGGASVVSANKGPLATAAAELRLAAAAHGGHYRASAAVCGGTPILELLASSFRGDRLERFEAVLNGSTNFILTRLEEGVRWEDAVAEARRLGILEADPSLDLLGIDAAAKAVILANHAWGTTWTLADAKAQGIMGVTAREAQEARASGLAIRLVARGSPDGGVSVAPVALPRDHVLAVEGKENAVRLKLAHAGTITLRGPGAGGRETAAAILSDLRAVRDALRDEAVEPVRPLLLARGEAAGGREA